VGSIMIKNILNFLDYILFLGMFYLMYLGLKHGPQIEQLIIELKGGAIWKWITIMQLELLKVL
jgi:hypothetical protein